MITELPDRWVIRLESKARCGTCGAWNPLDGLGPTFQCRMCSSRTTLAPADTARALEGAMVDGRCWAVGETGWWDEDEHKDLADRLEIRAERTGPGCPSCRRNVPEAALFEAEAACPSCKVLIPLEPVRASDAVSPRLRWLLRAPPDPEMAEALASFEHEALEAAERPGSFEPDRLSEALQAGYHVPPGVCWIGVALAPEHDAERAARVACAVAETEPALRAAGLVGLSPLPELVQRALEAQAESDWTDEEAPSEADETHNTLLGCALLGSMAGLAAIAGAAVIVALLAVLALAVVLLAT